MLDTYQWGGVAPLGVCPCIWPWSTLAWWGHMDGMAMLPGVPASMPMLPSTSGSYPGMQPFPAAETQVPTTTKHRRKRGGAGTLILVCISGSGAGSRDNPNTPAPVWVPRQYRSLAPKGGIHNGGESPPYAAFSWIFGRSKIHPAEQKNVTNSNQIVGNSPHRQKRETPELLA